MHNARTTILAVFVLTTTDGGTALVVSLLTVSLLSGYVLWGMSDDENQLLGSLENEDPTSRESTAPCIILLTEFLSKETAKIMDLRIQLTGIKSSLDDLRRLRKELGTQKGLGIHRGICPYRFPSQHLHMCSEGYRVCLFMCVCICLSVCMYVSQNLTSQMSN